MVHVFANGWRVFEQGSAEVTVLNVYLGTLFCYSAVLLSVLGVTDTEESEKTCKYAQVIDKHHLKGQRQ